MLMFYSVPELGFSLFSQPGRFFMCSNNGIPAEMLTRNFVSDYNSAVVIFELKIIIFPRVEFLSFSLPPHHVEDPRGVKILRSRN